jgi:threonylcarbamoyladenosine tRNA methylthiotransferase MtaB
VASFHIENFGCRAARADGEAVSNRLHAAGLGAQSPDEAGVVIVNTCSVTGEADRAARAFIRRTHRLNPAAKIVVTGCYAQRAPEELARLEGVSAVVGNSHKAFAPQIALALAQLGDESGVEMGKAIFSIHSLLSAGKGQAPIWADDRFAHSFLEDAQLVPGAQTRPNLKIQEGCGNRCTFCIIPHTRGSSRSLSADAVLKKVNGFVSAGGNELVLSGINLGRWGRDLESRSTLAALVRRIFSETQLPRLRLSSIEPMDWDDEMMALMAEFAAPRFGSHAARLCRHAHLPLQSGSDAVLRRMHRRYRPWHYAEKVAALFRAAGPELTLGADVMVGFPGETDREFEETMDMVRALPFGYLHLFPFSPRPGTRGWTLHAEAAVPSAEVEVRMAALRSLAAEKTRAHREQFAGLTLAAITLHTSGDLDSRGRTRALTENFVPLEIEGRLPANRLLQVRVKALDEESTLVAQLETDRHPGLIESSCPAFA